MLHNTDKVNKRQFSPNKNPLALYAKKYILQLKKKRNYLYFTYKMDTLDTIDQTQETIQLHTIAPRQKNFLDYYFDTKSPTRSN